MARKAKAPAKGSRNAVEDAMREVHNNIPSTVKRAKHFHKAKGNKSGKEAMLEAIAFKKAQEGK